MARRSNGWPPISLSSELLVVALLLVPLPPPPSPAPALPTALGPRPIAL